MGFVEDAKALVEDCESTIETIRNDYDNSLNEKEIKPKLLIQIKNFMENLRSSLDFTAHFLFDQYGDNSSQQNIYFPYAWDGLDLIGFRTKNRIEKCIPGITVSRPDIVAKIESYQHFADHANQWLPKFMDLNNENKHQQLTPQTKKEQKQLKISSGGTSISMGEGTSISMGPGTSISLGGMNIPGGQSFDVNKPPITTGSGKTEVITWVSFHFSTNNEAVLPLLTKSLNGVKKIVDELSNM